MNTPAKTSPEPVKTLAEVLADIAATERALHQLELERAWRRNAELARAVDAALAGIDGK